MRLTPAFCLCARLFGSRLPGGVWGCVRGAASPGLCLVRAGSPPAEAEAGWGAHGDLRGLAALGERVRVQNRAQPQTCDLY